MNRRMRWAFFVLVIVPALCLGAEKSPIRATWERPPKCEPFAPVRVQDLKEEVHLYPRIHGQIGFRCVRR